MQTKHYERLHETLIYDRMPNGLEVFILPKPGFQKTYATFTTKYGSMDHHFQPPGEGKLLVPDGIAHFLEHKMFEEPTGDIFAQFASQGASANAFTSFDRTAYLFSATEQIEANVETLLHFVQNPYFTDENVEKEKGIIGQEIDMYQDNADWRAYFGLIEALYQKHPVHIDIAGTKESIAKITKELLYTCYRTFYHPSNMMLFIVGGVEPEEMLLLVRDNQAKRELAPQEEIKRYFEEEPASVREAKRISHLPVSLPKCLIGFKDQPGAESGPEALRQELEMKLLLDLLFGPSSTAFQALYEERLISDQFATEYNWGAGYSFSVIGGETRNPERLVQRVREEVERVRQEGISDQDFERSKRKKIGAYLRLLNSPEGIANEFTKYRFKGIDFFTILDEYEALTRERVENRLRSHFEWDKQAVSIVATKEQLDSGDRG